MNDPLAMFTGTGKASSALDPSKPVHVAVSHTGKPHMPKRNVQSSIEEANAPKPLDDDDDLSSLTATAKPGKAAKPEPEPVDPATWAEEAGFLATWDETKAIPGPPTDALAVLTAAELTLLTVDIDGLNAELAALPTTIAAVSANLAEVSANYEASKGHIARLKGALDASYRATMIKPTEKSIEAKVATDARVAVAQDRARALYACKDRLWGLLEGLRTKRDALLAIGQNLRAELSNTPGVVKTPSGT